MTPEMTRKKDPKITPKLPQKWARNLSKIERKAAFIFWGYACCAYCACCASYDSYICYACCFVFFLLPFTAVCCRPRIRTPCRREWGKGCNVTLKKVMKIVAQRAGPPFWVPERCLNLTFGSLWVPYGPIVPPRLIFKGF